MALWNLWKKQTHLQHKSALNYLPFHNIKVKKAKSKDTHGHGGSKNWWVGEQIHFHQSRALSHFCPFFPFFSRFSHSPLIIPQKKKVRKTIHSRNFTVWPNSGECWILSSHIQLHCYKANACLPIHTDFLCPFCTLCSHNSKKWNT